MGRHWNTKGRGKKANEIGTIFTEVGSLILSENPPYSLGNSALETVWMAGHSGEWISCSL